MAFAASKRKRIGINRKPVEQLRLTSMIDMFTILLCYLLMSYSPTEIPSTDPNLMLPATVSTKDPTETTIIQAAKNMIIVDGNPMLIINSMKDYKLYVLKKDSRGQPLRNPDGSFMAEYEVADEMYVLPKVFETLKAKVEQYQGIAAKLNSPFKGEITIMCDKDMPYKVLKRVVATAGKAGFGSFKFAGFRYEGT